MKKLKKRYIITLLICLSSIYLFFFCDLFFFNPIRNKPDKIIVYHYGEQTEYSPKDKEFKRIYKALRSQSGITIFEMFTQDIIQASYRSYYDIDTHMAEGLALKLRYGNIQEGRLLGSNHAKYSDIIYPLGDLSQNLIDDYTVLYLNERGGYDSFFNYPYPEKANDLLKETFPKTE